jgi:hypothetical protein
MSHTYLPRQSAPVKRTITGATATDAAVEQSWIGTPGYPFAGVEQSAFLGLYLPFAGEGDE